jgi:hypothetical protein
MKISKMTPKTYYTGDKVFIIMSKEDKETYKTTDIIELTVVKVSPKELSCVSNIISLPNLVFTLDLEKDEIFSSFQEAEKVFLERANVEDAYNQEYFKNLKNSIEGMLGGLISELSDKLSNLSINSDNLSPMEREVLEALLKKQKNV